MAEPLYELLSPHLVSEPSNTLSSSPPASSPNVANYLTRLTTLDVNALSTTEPQALAQASHTNHVSLQALSSRSHRAIINASNSLSTLRGSLPALIQTATDLKDDIPQLDERALNFSTTYNKTNTENARVDRRKRAMLLSRNVDRLGDILELPTLLSTAISSSSAGSTGNGNSSSSSSSPTGGTNYSTALDLFAHIKRLETLHPESAIMKAILVEAEDAMKDMTMNLITSLRSQNIRLAAAIRAIGWLRRVDPELSSPTTTTTTNSSSTGAKKAGSRSTTTTTSLNSSADEGLFGTLFLTARLANLLSMLEALSPLRDLADQETSRRRLSLNQPPPSNKQGSRSHSHSKRISESSSNNNNNNNNYTTTSSSSGMMIHGQQTERYLKRYIEIFREQSFATVSMYRNIFPSTSSSLDWSTSTSTSSDLHLLLPLPSSLSTFPLHLSSILISTIQTYLPNITDPSARESLLTQVLYAAGSLGRLGADFGMMISLLGDDEEEDEEEKNDDDEGQEIDAEKGDGYQANGHGEDDEEGRNEHRKVELAEEAIIPEWARVMKKHRIQSGRLEAMATGQGQAAIRKGSSDTVVK